MKIVVTRPLPEAQATAERLRQSGHEPTLLPLTELNTLPVPEPAPSGIDIVAATSANAIRHAPRDLLENLSHLPLLTVGDRTAVIGREAGFVETTSAEGDVAGLIELALRTTQPGTSIAYLCGRPRRPDFELEMKATARHVTVFETYENRPVPPEPAALAALGDADAILIHARSAAELISGFFVEPPATVAVCISERAAEPLIRGGWRVLVSEKPSEDALLATLARL